MSGPNKIYGVLSTDHDKEIALVCNEAGELIFATPNVADPVPVNPAGRAYSTPIRLKMPDGVSQLHLTGTTVTSHVIDRGGYNAMTITWAAGTMTTILPQFSDSAAGVYSALIFGQDAAGILQPALNLSSTSVRREYGPLVSPHIGATVYTTSIVGGRYVNFLITGTAGQDIDIDVVLATL